MFKSLFIALTFFSLVHPFCLLASDDLAILEAVVAANQKVQPGLEHYLVTVETSRIQEMMSRMTSGIPSDVAPPPTPTITKFWQRNGKSIVYSQEARPTPYAEKMVKQISSNLAIELNEMLLPPGKAEQRLVLAKDAAVKSSEVALADSLIKRLEISFNQPTDLDGAFYANGMRLPQKQVKSLVFDIDTKSETVTELVLVTGDGLQLTLEMRYLDATGGRIPERFRITSPGGKIDDHFKVKFVEVEDFLLPASMHRVIRRPELQEDLEVFFIDYQVNQPIPEDVQLQLKNQ